MDLEKLIGKLKQYGLQERPSQRGMIEAVYEALQTKKILCVEAPTGTGKTLSYGLASLAALKPKQHIVISTATIALQEQLINKDLPLIENLTDKEFKYALAKGRRRYVCHERLYGSEQSDLFKDQSSIEKLQNLLDTKKWNGDRDELKIQVSSDTWNQVSTDATGCSGKRCQFYEDCAFYKARRKMHQADVIVANHSLLLSDLELGGGAILPDMNSCIYIIDECHHLPQKALSHFSKMATLLGSVEWINQLTKLMAKAVQLDEATDETQTLLKSLTHQLIQQLKTMSDYLDSQSEKFADDILLLGAELKDPTLKTLAQEIEHTSKQVYLYCHQVQQSIESTLSQNEKIKKESDEELNRLFTSINFIESRAKNLYDTWSLFCRERQPKEAPIAKWFSKSTYYQCHAAPINVSKELQEYFWEKITNGIVLCSATIRTLGKFEDFHRRSGLSNDKRVIDLAIEPFFDYTKSVLFIPKMHSAPQGTQQNEHHLEALALLPQLILPRTGTLVLFASNRAMEQTYAGMPANFIDDIYMQNQYSKQRLIELHKDRIRSGKRSILFGLASLGEGLDLPADFCQHVIIHKLPFSVPSTPIEMTRNDWLKANNKNAFMLSSLPETALRLTQYIGRLIRQEEDIGIVSILDNRLYTKSYGKALIKDFPPFHYLINESIDTLKGNPSIAHLY